MVIRVSTKITVRQNCCGLPPGSFIIMDEIKGVFAYLGRCRGAGEENGEEWAVQYLDRTGTFPPRIYTQGGTLTCTKSESVSKGLPWWERSFARGIAEIISVKHSDSMQSNVASARHLGNEFLHQVAICFSKCPCRPSLPSIYQFKCCKLIMCHCALSCFRLFWCLYFLNSL